MCIARLVHICLIVREALPIYSAADVKRPSYTTETTHCRRQAGGTPRRKKCGNLFVYNVFVYVQPFGVLEKFKIVFTIVVCVFGSASFVYWIE